MTEPTTTTLNRDLEAQREYSDRIEQLGFDFGLTVADAFVRGIRDIGYRDTARAIDELIDNSVQADATQVLVELGFGEASDSKPTALAVVDDGHGMDPKMIRLAAIWGGTHRENDRTGFGRYGYGLPSSCVSQGRRFTVYSVVEGGDLHSVTLDLDEIREGKYGEGGRIVMPQPEPAELPRWLAEEVEMHFAETGFTHGTVVLIEKLDRLTWKTKSALERQLLQSLGITYRNFLRDVDIWVNGKGAEPTDPLFTTPGFRFYDLDSDRAVAYEPHSFEVKDAESGEPLGTVKVRYASMPPTFARVDKATERGKNNARFAIMANTNGIIVMRNGRQIDVVSQRPWLSVNNDDRYWGVEIDVPAALDDEMAITTSKQQVVLSERMWDLLDNQGVLTMITELRRRYDDEKARLKEERERGDDDEARTSEEAMLAADKFKTKKPADSPERRQKAEENLTREAERRAKEAGVPAEEVERQLRAESEKRPYKVEFEENGSGAPFFRVQQLSGQRVLWLNRSHRFFREVYAHPESTARVRAGVEVLLFAIGSAELDAQGERAVFYETERNLWSTTLNAALSQLAEIEPREDSRESAEEINQLDDDRQAEATDAGA
jgi:hypothetical protein